MTLRLLALARKPEETEGAAMSRNILASDRALLMEALSALAPLIQHAQTLEVTSLKAIERKRCTEHFQAGIELLGGTGT